VREAEHSTPCTAVLKNLYSLNSTQSDNFTFLFIPNFWRCHLNISRFSAQMSY